MTPRTVLTLHALIAIGFAIPLIASPADFLWLYGLEADAVGVFLARLFGGSLVAFSGITWLARNEQEGGPIHAICGGMAAGMACGLFASLHFQLTSPSVTALGWTTVAIYLGLFVAYAVLFLGRSARRDSDRLQAS
jgi:hypothetical protein